LVKYYGEYVEKVDNVFYGCFAVELGSKPKTYDRLRALAVVSVVELLHSKSINVQELTFANVCFVHCIKIDATQLIYNSTNNSTKQSESSAVYTVGTIVRDMFYGNYIPDDLQEIINSCTNKESFLRPSLQQVRESIDTSNTLEDSPRSSLLDIPSLI
jgi:hypothetical protein